MLLSLQELDKQNNRMRCTTDGLTTVVAMTIHGRPIPLSRPRFSSRGGRGGVYMSLRPAESAFRVSMDRLVDEMQL